MIEIRQEEMKDRGAVLQLVHDAFGQWDESDLIKRLYLEEEVLFGLVAEEEGKVLGHILFSVMEVQSPELILSAAALAPLAVLPERQKEGIGSKLVEAGIQICRNNVDLAGIIVLGDPDYYRRFGFSSELAEKLDGPFTGECFMALEFRKAVLPEGAKIGYGKAFALE
ncbi:N-acetyltransferase [Kiloniella laminariae]|uniref:N-acetyltransferase n=1 Tax=Kiloniella laminariae TaxID=454162 RepID=A0ABT4LG91_9PROT|nr:N-acetyltransferase [Kiloniella laminariae]MCZ4280116.1 N-acetyltransferase [Kiloniella laminariae]